MTEELSADVVVVGYGAAGASAAIEAADNGADVVVIDRFSGGGASAVSGGVVYAGGGTAQQRAAGIDDSVDAMVDYLALEAGDVVSAETLRDFCAGSADMITWLEGNGVPFEGSLCPDKTSYPSDDYYLYYSGSESAGGFRDAAAPAARGHRAKGSGTSGRVLFAGLAASARRKGVRTLTQTRVTGLRTGADGEITGLTAVTLRDAPRRVRRAHHLLSKYSAKPGLYLPPLRRALHQRAERLERAHGKEITIAAPAVVLSAGGFIANREMSREHAPAYRGGLPLGTSGDDGSGIRMGVDVGGATGEMDRISAWRFITPPSAFIGGILVDAKGERIIDESRYGAAVGEAMVSRHDNKGWLLVDDAIVREARKRIRTQGQWFQYLQTRYLLATGRKVGADPARVAREAGVDPGGLVRALADYNGTTEGVADSMGKPPEFVRRLDTPPYSLIDVGIRHNVGFPCPMLTLGGLVVDERTGRVLGADGTAVPGLYAAGRSAVGICSHSYVSGLSLADCVYSGRRAGRHSAGATRN